MEETQEGRVQGLPVQLESLACLAPWGSPAPWRSALVMVVLLQRLELFGPAWPKASLSSLSHLCSGCSQPLLKAEHRGNSRGRALGSRLAYDWV